MGQIRNPKSKIRKKSEIRNPRCDFRIPHDFAINDFAIPLFAPTRTRLMAKSLMAKSWEKQDLASAFRIPNPREKPHKQAVPLRISDFGL